MRRTSISWLTGCFVLLAIAVLGCETREITERKQASSGGKLLFSDNFEDEELGDEWYRGSGENGSGRWQIKDGWLSGANIKNDPLWLDVKLPEKVRVEFDAKAMSSTGDLKAEIFGDGERHASGYILIFGGWGNKLDVIARLDEHGDDRKEKPTAKVEKGKVYHWAIERRNGTLRWYIDDELFMSYDDPKPLRGTNHRYFGFNDWTAPVRFDNVEVYELN